MKKIATLFAFLVLAGLAYLLFWPVPISPKAWDAPKNAGYTGPFVPNTELVGLKSLTIGDHHGPEDVAAKQVDGKWQIYTSTQSGDIIRIDPVANTATVVGNTGGVALGLDIDADGNLIIADAHKGLLRMDEAGKITVLSDRADGIPIQYADELAIASDGKIYFSDASTKFGAKAAGSTLAGSLLELMEHGSTGRILVYNPADQTTKTVLKGLSFPNGIAMCPEDRCLLFAETGTYSIKRYWLEGEKAGTVETIIDNLPGFPDNLNRGQDGRYWFGLTSPRAEALDNLSDKPFVRKIVQRLPAGMRPKAVSYGFVAAIDMDGNVIAQYQDPSGEYPLTTGAIEPGDGWLYVSSLAATRLGRKDIRNAPFNR
ncbi:MAG TPA: SMP-30/gluconolactonase/LRE family protein [Hellea balneolensis]|uniref:SMP-30/gluconolactonase/LRE family protein n=1 Tax=Hellea balneolensis TaxID=287478 RepID=A0A7C5R4J9_9PROT|nr:SMP-30/gluconolactonase/LRE family protein [Hellea balneolensis]